MLKIAAVSVKFPKACEASELSLRSTLIVMAFCSKPLPPRICTTWSKCSGLPE